MSDRLTLEFCRRRSIPWSIAMNVPDRPMPETQWTIHGCPTALGWCPAHASSIRIAGPLTVSSGMPVSGQPRKQNCCTSRDWPSPHVDLSLRWSLFITNPSFVSVSASLTSSWPYFWDWPFSVGQYCAHFSTPPSFSLVSIMITRQSDCHTILQKSLTVSEIGFCRLLGREGAGRGARRGEARKRVVRA